MVVYQQLLFYTSVQLLSFAFLNASCFALIVIFIFTSSMSVLNYLWRGCIVQALKDITRAFGSIKDGQALEPWSRRQAINALDEKPALATEPLLHWMWCRDSSDVFIIGLIVPSYNIFHMLIIPTHYIVFSLSTNWHRLPAVQAATPTISALEFVVCGGQQ